MCGLFTLHHKFRIDSGRTKFKQGKTDSILYGCESHAQESPRSKRAWLDPTTCCSVRTKEVEKTPGYGVVGRFQLAQRKGLKFYQTRCNAIILYDTFPAYCISKVVVMESGEIIYEKVYVSPRPPPTISFNDNWMKELDSEVAESSKDRSSEDIQRIELKPNTQLSSTGRPVTRRSEETLERTN